MSKATTSPHERTSKRSSSFRIVRTTEETAGERDLKGSQQTIKRSRSLSGPRPKDSVVRSGKAKTAPSESPKPTRRSGSFRLTRQSEFDTAEVHARSSKETTQEQRTFRVIRKQRTGIEEGEPPRVEVVVSETTTDRRAPQDATKKKPDSKAAVREPPSSRLGTKKGTFLRSLRRKLDGTEEISRSSKVVREPTTQKGADRVVQKKTEEHRALLVIRELCLGEVDLFESSEKRGDEMPDKRAKSTDELTRRSHSLRAARAKQDEIEAQEADKRSRPSDRRLGRSRSLRIAQNGIDYTDEKENVSKSETHITASSPSLRKERYSSTHLARSLEPAAFTTSDESGMFEDDETMDSVSAHDRTFVRTPTDSSRIQVSPESFREWRHAQGSIHMAPRFPEGLDFWKPPGTGSLFAKLYQSWTQETAVSPAEAEDNSRVMFRSAASLFFRKGFAALLRNETPGPGYYNPSIGERLRFPRMPSFTIRRKLKCPKKEPTPAPWDYSPDKADPLVRPMSPSYTFGHKGDCCHCRSTSPGWYTRTVAAHDDHSQASTLRLHFHTWLHPVLRFFRTWLHICTPSPRTQLTRFFYFFRPPGAYDPERADQCVRSLEPSYTFGVKYKDPKRDDFPAPGTYCPEKSDTVLATTPAYTFGFKHKDLRPDDVPAPGAYCPEKADTVLAVTPAYTFGIKPKDAKPDDIPAPGAYRPEKADSVLVRTPAYTFGARPKDSRDDGLPASTTYRAPTRTRASPPAYTLSYRTNIPSDHTKKPGPGAHSPERVWMNKSSSPRFTFRHPAQSGCLRRPSPSRTFASDDAQNVRSPHRTNGSYETGYQHYQRHSTDKSNAESAHLSHRIYADAMN
ncbi:hypothetical protein MTO96_014698 [Rhipicephalus appendiculatus]